jgi:transcriptional regulator with XRE-family HTH domain
MNGKRSANPDGYDIVPHRAYLGYEVLIRDLRAERERRGLSLADVARRSGLDKAAVSRLETYQQGNPTLVTLLRYADALGVRLEWSFRRSGEPQASEGKPARRKRPVRRGA